MRRIKPLLCAIILGMSASCAPSAVHTGESSAQKARTHLITRQEIESREWANAYELVATLRPHWLNPRGDDSFGTPVELQVHYNGTRAGGVNFLRETNVAQLNYLEFIDPISATARWGINYGKGAIVLSTQPQ